MKKILVLDYNEHLSPVLCTVLCEYCTVVMVVVDADVANTLSRDCLSRCGVRASVLGDGGGNVSPCTLLIDTQSSSNASRVSVRQREIAKLTGTEFSDVIADADVVRDDDDGDANVLWYSSSDLIANEIDTAKCT